MDNDDLPVGRILSRRDVLALFGAASAVALAAACGDDGGTTSSQSPGPTEPDGGSPAQGATRTAASPPASPTAGSSATGTAAPDCVVSPALTEGPFFVDDRLNRSDIRSDPGSGRLSEGVPLALTFLVSSVASNACAALPKAIVDVWHCDAEGAYSAETQGQAFLRGFQETDSSGRASFKTIYPGWYQGRAVHIHFKIRGGAGSGSFEFTSQLFFDEVQNDEVFVENPYNSTGKRSTLNNNDSIFRDSGGQTLLKVTRAGEGYEGTFHVGLEL